MLIRQDDLTVATSLTPDAMRALQRLGKEFIITSFNSQ